MPRQRKDKPIHDELPEGAEDIAPDTGEESEASVIAGLGEREDFPAPSQFLSSGSLLLDLAISDRYPGGGYPVGRFVQIYGMESTGKTAMACEPLGAAQRRGGRAIFVDAESTLDWEFVKLFGVEPGPDPYTDTETWSYYPNVKSIEDLFDRIIKECCEKKCDPDKPNIMVVDSLSAIGSRTEHKQNLGDATYGTSRAKAMSLAFRKYLQKCSDANLGIIFIDQSRMSMNSYGPDEVCSGGKALPFYASVRINMRMAGRIRAKIDGPVIGVKLAFECVKNKIAPPFRQAALNLLFNYGVDDISSNILYVNEASDTGKSTLKCEDCGYEVEVNSDVKATQKICPECNGKYHKQRKGGGYDVLGHHHRGIADAVRYVETNDLEQQLRDETHRIWKQEHAITQRKEKIR